MDIFLIGIVQSLKLFCELDLFSLHDEDEYSKEIKRVRRPVVRIENYIERVVPNLQAQQFQNHFRISRATYIKLLPVVNNLIQKQTNIGRHRIDVERQLLAVLWLLATPDSYR